ncbi:hypothetical protein ACFFP0_15545 [Rhizobium puerariae]|uniref:Glycosyltransferase n=1 Tax=Rhizobium puerariae TaxID=1585791 RepID=A0ABV6AK89_9HYPH
MFSSLVKCNGFSESEIFVFVDGPKTEIDAPHVKAVRDFVDGLPFPNIRKVFREKNMGLRHSIAAGVTSLCNEYGRVIVFEDDFELSPVTLDYFRQALDKYADNDRVWNIVAYMYRVPGMRARKEALVLPFTHPWGWATWDRAWRHFELDKPVPAPVLKSHSFKTFFSLAGLRDYPKMLEMAMNGRVNSWFIQWYYCMFRSGGVSVFPSQTLIRNTGIQDGTHGSSLNPYHRMVPRDELALEMPRLPDVVAVDYVALDTLIASRDAWSQRIIDILGRYKRTLKRMLNMK